MLRFPRMMAAEDATTTEEVPAEVSVAQEVLLQDVKAVLPQDVKAVSEATGVQPQKKAVSPEGHLEHVTKDFLKDLLDVQKALVMHLKQNDQERAKSF